MCDFHSVIVTGDGRILHHPSNSHSTTASFFALDTGLDAAWWECEWNGIGDMSVGPYGIVQLRGKSVSPTSLAVREATRHYEKLAKIMAGEADPLTTAPFDQPEYCDVREKLQALEAERAKQVAISEAEALGENLATSFDDMTVEAQILAIRALAETLSIDMTDIAAEEISEAEESAEERGSESSYESGREDGYEAASEELYTQEYMDEQIGEAVEKATDEDSECYQKAFEAGFLACKTGATPAVQYINGLPSFLFT